MDVVFLYSGELNWEENLARARHVLGKVTAIDGSGATSIKNAYERLLDQVRSPRFMMIEGDNYVLDNVTAVLDETGPVKYWSTNKYEITYEHGGVKVLDTEAARRQLTNVHIHRNFEVSANLFLPSRHIVVSEHRFDFSPKNEWVTIAKELIKLYVWGHYSYLDAWLQHVYPREVFIEVREELHKTSLSGLFETLLPSLGKIYDSRHSA